MNELKFRWFDIRYADCATTNTIGHWSLSVFALWCVATFYGGLRQFLFPHPSLCIYEVKSAALIMLILSTKNSNIVHVLCFWLQWCFRVYVLHLEDRRNQRPVWSVCTLNVHLHGFLKPYWLYDEHIVTIKLLLWYWFIWVFYLCQINLHENFEIFSWNISPSILWTYSG